MKRNHSELEISLLRKGILVIVSIRFLSFCVFYFSGEKVYGRIIQVQEAKKRSRKGAFKYYISIFFWGLNKNADTADANPNMLKL